MNRDVILNSKNQQHTRYIHTNWAMLVIAQKSTKAVSAVTYRLGLRGHVAQLPLKMCHIAKIKTLSVWMAPRRQLAIPVLTRQSCHRKGPVTVMRCRGSADPLSHPEYLPRARQFFPNHKHRRKRREKRKNTQAEAHTSVVDTYRACTIKCNIKECHSDSNPIPWTMTKCKYKM